MPISSGWSRARWLACYAELPRIHLLGTSVNKLRISFSPLWSVLSSATALSRAVPECFKPCMKLRDERRIGKVVDVMQLVRIFYQIVEFVLSAFVLDVQVLGGP